MWTLIALTAIYYAGRALFNRFTHVKTRRGERVDLSVPVADAGAPYPLVWGTVRVQQPLLVDRFGYGSTDVPIGDDFTIATYGASMLFVLGVAPTQGEYVTIQRVWFGDKLMPTGTDEFAWHPIVADTNYNGDGGGGGIGSVPGLGLYVSIANLFGKHINGLGSVGGNGIAGTFELRSGQADLGTSLNPTAFYSHFAQQTNRDLARFPDYKGKIKIALSGYAEPFGFLPAGFMFGEDQQPPPPAFELSIAPFADETPPEVPQYYKLVGLDWNPMGVIHNVLTQHCRISESDIDLDSLNAAATTLAGELHGYSRILYDQINAADLIDQILDEVGGVRYQDPETGLITFGLVRDDYDIGDLLVFDESNIVSKPEITPGSWRDTFNIVTVTFLSREKEYSDDVATAQNSASVSAIGRKHMPLRLEGAKTMGAAQLVAARRLKLASSPLRKLKIQVNRDGITVRPGHVIAYSFAAHGISLMPFRVARVDAGTLRDGRITIEAVEDAFHIDDALLQGDPDATDVQPLVFPPAPIVEQSIDQAPRWLQYKAALAGGPSEGTQHLLHLAVPNDYDDRYRADIHRTSTPIADFTASDLSPVPFPPSFLVAEDYPRTADPYDTTGGLLIDTLEGWTPATVTASDIRSAGANLIRLGSGDNEEWIAFESATPEGGGYRLNNVWRGLLDTTPKDHAVGERGHPILLFEDPDWSRRVGKRSAAPFGSATETTVIVAPIPISSTGTELTGEETLSLEAVKGYGTDASRGGPRIELPYPVADLTANGDKEVLALAEDGVLLDWAPRARETNSVSRGDDADETVTATTTFAVFMAKAGADEDGYYFELTDPPTTKVPLGTAGHGDITVKVRTFTDWDGTEERRSWQDATVNVEALFWRNLLINGRFADNLASWSTVSGVPTVHTTASEQLGFKTGLHYIGGDGVDEDPVSIRQVIPVQGYHALGSLTIEVYSYARTIIALGTPDNYELLVEQLDSGGSVVDSDSYSGTPSNSHFERQEVTLLMDPDCDRIRITATLTPDVATPVSSRITELCCRIVPTSGELVTNSDFEVDVASWTVVSGTWTRVTSSPNAYIGSGYIASTGVAASAQAYQEIAISPKQNSIAVLEYAHTSRTDSDDTHEVGLIALDGAGGSTLDEIFSGNQTTTTSQWDRNRLVLALPHDCTHVRIQLNTARVGDAGAPDGGFDDIRLKVYHLIDPATDVELDFTAPPTTALPSSILRWYYDVPTIHPAPRLGIFAGGLAGDGQAPPMVVPSTATIGSRFVGPWDGETCVYEAYRTTRAGSPVRSQLATYADMPLQSFTVIAVIKTDEVPLSDTCGLVGRRAAGASGRGWEIYLDDTGHPVANLVGTNGSVSATSSLTVDDGMLHMIALVVNTADEELSIVVDNTWDTVSYVTADIGGLRTFDGSYFGIGRAHADEECFPGQIARVYMFFDNLTAADLSSWWHHNDLPDGVSAADHDACAVTWKASSGGVAVQWLPADVVPYIYASSFEVSGENGWGIALPATTANLASAGGDDPWTTPGGQTGSTFLSNVEDVQGKLHGFSMTGDETTHSYIQVALTAATRVRHVFFAKRAAGDGTVNLLVELQDTDEDVKSSATKSVGESWTRIDVELSGWDAATPNGRLVYYARSAAGADVTLIMSGPHAVFQPTASYKQTVVRLPLAGDASIPGGQFTLDPDYFELTPRFNAEGEIRIDCQTFGSSEIRDAEIVNIGNDPLIDDKDRRLIDCSTDLRFIHSDAAEAGNQSEITPAGGSLDDPWQLRARWTRTGFVEDAPGTARFAGFEYNAQTDYDRVATFSATVTAAPTTITIGGAGGTGPEIMMRRIRIASREISPP